MGGAPNPYEGRAATGTGGGSVDVERGRCLVSPAQVPRRVQKVYTTRSHGAETADRGLRRGVRSLLRRWRERSCRERVWSRAEECATGDGGCEASNGGRDAVDEVVLVGAGSKITDRRGRVSVPRCAMTIAERERSTAAVSTSCRSVPMTGRSAED
ncbi:uncharacterized protein SCHCODRAFT_01226264 [Schizophyllum commune H4-8]|uniref:uncharacterized protein n=1 Tax=Schizophyllum commune (strain H4-8 / FGSC 9210) TaxID=578458 RepID=UPI00215FCF3F|nr:uncharacterized protein SCHCODRAFT_01226264 [Schizophyllum commune H4-8]KAI5894104.1 hypothetical protein SCHCODRAFT_01226264 [Schizophyllum commune H4-8]